MNKFKKTLATVSASATALALSATQAYAQLGQVTVPEDGFATSIGSLISGLLNFVMLIAALLVFLYLIWGGIEWITSGGDKSKTEGARNKITAAIIGLIVLAASYAILQLALNFLGFEEGIQSLFSNPPQLND